MKKNWHPLSSPLHLLAPLPTHLFFRIEDLSLQGCVSIMIITWSARLLHHLKSHKILLINILELFSKKTSLWFESGIFCLTWNHFYVHGGYDLTKCISLFSCPLLYLLRVLIIIFYCHINKIETSNQCFCLQTM